MATSIRNQSSSPHILPVEERLHSQNAESGIARPPLSPSAPASPRVLQRRETSLSPIQPISVTAKTAKLDSFAASLQNFATSTTTEQNALLEYALEAGFEHAYSLQDAHLEKSIEISAFEAALTTLKELLSDAQSIEPKSAPSSPSDKFPYEHSFAVRFVSTPSGQGTATARMSASGELGRLIIESEATGSKVFDKDTISTYQRPSPRASTNEETERRLAKGKQRADMPSSDVSRASSPFASASPLAPSAHIEFDARLATTLQQEELERAIAESNGLSHPYPEMSQVGDSAQPNVHPFKATPGHDGGLGFKRGLSVFSGSSGLSEEDDGLGKSMGTSALKKPRTGNAPAESTVSEEANLSQPSLPVAGTSAGNSSHVPASYADVQPHPFVQDAWAALPEDRKSAQGLYAVLASAKARQSDGQTMEDAVNVYLTTFNKMTENGKSATIGDLVAAKGTLSAPLSECKIYVDAHSSGSAKLLNSTKNFSTFLQNLPKLNGSGPAEKSLKKHRGIYVAISKLVFPLLPFQADVAAALGNAVSQRILDDAFAVDEWVARKNWSPKVLLEATEISRVCELVQELRHSSQVSNAAKSLIVKWRAMRHQLPMDKILQQGFLEIDPNDKDERHIRLCIDALPCVAALKNRSDREVLASLASGGMKNELAEFLGRKSLSGSLITALKTIGKMKAVQNYLNAVD